MKRQGVCTVRHCSSSGSRYWFKWCIAVVLPLVVLLNRRSLSAAWHSNRGHVKLATVLLSHNPLSMYNPLQAATKQQDGRFQQVSDAFDLALDDQADYSPAVFGLGLLNLTFGNYVEAANNLQVALLSRPGVANLGLGLALYKSGDLDGARAMWCGSQTLDYFRALAHRQLGLGLVGDSIRLFEVIVSLTPDSVQAWLDVGEAYVNAQDWEKASEAYGHALALDPANVDAQLAMAPILFYGYKDAQAARSLLADALPRLAIHSVEDEIRLHSVYLLLGRTWEREEEFDQAIIWYEKALGLPRMSARSAFLNIARVYQLRGDFQEALLWVERARSAYPRDPVVWIYLGDLRLNMGDLSGAVAAYEQAVSLQPDNVNYRNALARTLLEAGEIGRAEEEFRKVLATDPANPSALEGLRRLNVEP